MYKHHFFRAPVGALVFSTLFAGCAFIGDRSSEYKSAEDGRALVIPDGLSTSNVSERYRIPDSGSTTVLEGKYVLPQPPDATSSLSDDPYTLKQIADDAWLELSMPPSKVWPLVDGFWQSYGVDHHVEAVSEGYFASETLSANESHQALITDLEATSHSTIVIEGVSFQTRLKQGLKRNTSEVQVRALLPNVVQASRKEWQVGSVTPSIERALLELLGERVTSEQNRLRYSLNAVDIGDESLVKLLDDEAGYPFLEIKLDFDRAWIEVEDALEASPAFVSSREKDQGVVTISYLSEEEIKSWYTLKSSLAERKAEKNLELKFYSHGPELMHVRAKLLTDKLEPEAVRALIELVFEYLS